MQSIAHVGAPSESPSALRSFARGVLAVVDAWPAFRIAQDERTIVGDVLETRLHLATEIVDAFADGTVPPASDLADFLLRFMEGECDLSLEDGSEVSTAKTLLQVWATPHGPDRDALLERLEQHARADRRTYRREVADVSDGGSDASGHGDNAMDVDSLDQVATAAPVVDEDGFELVQRKGRGAHRSNRGD
jgi:pre-rRNA-processing protein TSR2